jgi:malate synthase
MSPIEIRGSVPRQDELFTPQARDFLVELDRRFAGARVDLLERRRRRRTRLARGAETLGFLPETAAIRDDPTWRVAAPAPGLVDRRVEITGPPQRTMTVNALNSGAKVWLADFEDATSPTWENIVGGQINLIDARAGRLDFTAGSGKRYRVGDDPATVVVRPRGWHLVEKHVVVDGHPMPAALVDFGLYLFHNREQPYFYLPKLEGHREARLWNDVFCHAQQMLGLPHGTIRATVLIETITAAFEMEEILYELRDHSAGLNAGRWDYIFSVIKTFGADPAAVLPDRANVRMTVPFMRAYSELLVKTCHRRGAHAIGGMAAFIPSRDTSANERAFAHVRVDKEREASAGFDGSWVAHPALVPVARDVFDRHLGENPHQVGRQRFDVNVTADDLLDFASAGTEVTETGVRNNIAVALRYLREWLGGTGAVAVYDLMEDAATAEIARCQIWQWLRHGTRLTDGRAIDHELVAKLLDEEYTAAEAETGERDENLARAGNLFNRIALQPDLPEFFTTRAYATYLAR